MLFLLNLFKNFNLCTSYIKQIMNVFKFVQWNKYFHSVKDEMYHSTRFRLVEWNISSFTSWKYLYHCTHKHSLFVYYLLFKANTLFNEWLKWLDKAVFPWLGTQWFNVMLHISIKSLILNWLFSLPRCLAIPRGNSTKVVLSIRNWVANIQLSKDKIADF